MKYDWIALDIEGIDNENALGEIRKATFDMAEESYYLIMYSDTAIKSGKWEEKILEEIRYNRLLDLRIFNFDKEVRIWRSSLSASFNLRKADDDAFRANIENGIKDTPIGFSDRIHDEVQYLDIDMAESENLGMDADGTFIVKTTGGGKYTLPVAELSENLSIRIRNYIDFYESTGQAVCADWRIVAYEERSGN